MKIFLSKTNLQRFKFLKNSINEINKFASGSAKMFSTLTKSNKGKKKQVENNELYTTSSYLSENGNDLVNNLKSNLSQESENKKIQFNKKFLIILPLVFGPFSFHFALDLFEGLVFSNFFHYSFEIALKHMFLINTFNTGILLGYTLSLSDSEKNIDYKKVFLRVGLTVASFFICNVITSQTLNPYIFNSLYLALTGSSLYIANGISNLHPLYTKYSQIIILLGMTIILLLINYNFKEWNTKISEEGKFEDTVKFYELSKDKEFAKVMDRLEKNLKEIDIKIAKRKE